MILDAGVCREDRVPAAADFVTCFPVTQHTGRKLSEYPDTRNERWRSQKSHKIISWVLLFDPEPKDRNLRFIFFSVHLQEEKTTSHQKTGISGASKIHAFIYQIIAAFL